MSAESLKFEGKIAELCCRGEVYARDIAADSSRIGGGKKWEQVSPCCASILGGLLKQSKRGSLPATTEGIALFQRSLSSALLPPT